MLKSAARLLGRLAIPAAVLFALIAGLGLLVTKQAAHYWPLTAEDSVNRDLASERSGDLNSLTNVLSHIGNTEVIIATMAVLAIVFRLAFKRWRESVFLVTVVSTQALVFLLTTLVIDRQRPDVPKLDDSPPTSSFPSGHTGAATALYLGTALAIALHTRRVWLRWLVILAFLVVPLTVGSARLYRGMHHPSDIAVAVLNGALCVLIGWWVVLRDRKSESESGLDGGRPGSDRSGSDRSGSHRPRRTSVAA